MPEPPPGTDGVVLPLLPTPLPLPLLEAKAIDLRGGVAPPDVLCCKRVCAALLTPVLPGCGPRDTERDKGDEGEGAAVGARLDEGMVGRGWVYGVLGMRVVEVKSVSVKRRFVNASKLE